VTEQGTVLIYNGTPGAGTLIGSIAASAGTDSFGNHYPAGFQFGSGTGAHLAIDLSGDLSITDSTDTTQVAITSSSGDVTVGTAANGTINLLPAVGQLNIQNPAGNSQIILDGQGQVVEIKETQFDTYIQLNTAPAQIIFAINNPSVHGALISLGGGAPNPATPYLLLDGPTGGTGNWDDQLTMGMWPGKTPGNGNVRPRLIVTDNFASQNADIWLSGNMVTCSLDGSTANTWQAGSGFGSGWAIGPSSGTVQNFQYGIANGCLILDGAVHTTSTTPASVLITLPAAYRPPITKRGPYAVLNAGGNATVLWCEVNSNGQVSLHGVPAVSGNDVYFSARIPLNSTNPT
jgi:hypothetical protein